MKQISVAQICRTSAMGWLALVGAGLLALGCVNFFNPAVFQEALASHDLFSNALTSALVWVVPGLECVIGSGLVIAAIEASGNRSNLVDWAGVSAACILMSFSGYAFILSIVPPPKPASCGCGLSMKPVQNWGYLGAIDAGLACSVIGATALSRRRHHDVLKGD